MGDNPQEIETDPVATVKHPDNLYRAVRSVMAGRQDPLKLNPRMKYNRGEDPGFMGPGDERILRNANMCSMEEKRISSVSFDPVSGRCYTCLNGDHRAWFDMLPEPELRLLRNARKCWEDTYLGKTRRGQGWADYRLNLVLPVSLSMEAGTIPCTSGEWGERPTALVRLNEAGERYWIEKIANELNREVGLGLATAWSVGRTMSAVCRQEESVAMGRVFSIGASNAGNTAAALERKGVKVVPISQPGCSVTRESVDSVVRRLNAELKKDDIVLIQWLENSIFFMLNSDTGSMVLPSRDEQDGIFHVTGKVTVSKDVQLEALLDKLEPLLSGYPDNLKMLLCPLVRYLEDCCAGHPRDELVRKEDVIRQMKELYQLRRVLKSRIIRKKFKNVIMFDPLACLGAAASVDKAKAVMADCFHLNARAREIVAVEVKEQIVGWLRGRKRGSDTKAGSEDKRPRLDSAAYKGGPSVSGVRKSGTAAASRSGGGKGQPKGRGKGRN